MLRFPFDTFPIQIFEFLGLRVSLLQLFMLFSAITLMVILTYYLYRTPLGTRIRSVSGNERAAVLSGPQRGGSGHAVVRQGRGFTVAVR